MEAFPPLAVAVEAGRRRTFAWVEDWPGWCRWGRDEAGALARLAAAADRYRTVAAQAGHVLPALTALAVRQRLAGSATTDFGVPGAVSEADGEPLTEAGAARLAGLVEAAWAVFDGVVAASPPQLRRGPRGGGRDRDAIVAHVVEAEVAYARKLGLRLGPADPADRAAVGEARAAVAGLLRAARSAHPGDPKGWPPRYGARRVAWHVLDHAWEIEDRRP